MNESSTQYGLYPQTPLGPDNFISREHLKQLRRFSAHEETGLPFLVLGETKVVLGNIQLSFLHDHLLIGCCFIKSGIESLLYISSAAIVGSKIQTNKME